MKIECKSYLKIKNEFVFLDDFAGALPDPDYVEGAIYLKINGVLILDEALWDLVDQLWAYIVNAMNDLAHGRSHEVNFPDQPTPICFKILDQNRVEFSVGYEGRQVIVYDINAFIRVMLKEARSFFEKMDTISIESSGKGCATELGLIEKITNGIPGTVYQLKKNIVIPDS